MDCFSMTVYHSGKYGRSRVIEHVLISRHVLGICVKYIPIPFVAISLLGAAANADQFAVFVEKTCSTPLYNDLIRDGIDGAANKPLVSNLILILVVIGYPIIDALFLGLKCCFCDVDRKKHHSKAQGVGMPGGVSAYRPVHNMSQGGVNRGGPAVGRMGMQKPRLINGNNFGNRRY